MLSASGLLARPLKIFSLWWWRWRAMRSPDGADRRGKPGGGPSPPGRRERERHGRAGRRYYAQPEIVRHQVFTSQVARLASAPGRPRRRAASGGRPSGSASSNRTCGNCRGQLVAGCGQVFADVPAGGQEVRQHHHPRRPGLNARLPAGVDVRLGQFQVRTLHEPEPPAGPHVGGDVFQVGVRFGPAAAVGDEEEGVHTGSVVSPATPPATSSAARHRVPATPIRAGRPRAFGSGTATKSADLPASRLPHSSAQPSASAPLSVTIRSNWSPGKSGYRPRTNRASARMSRSGLDGQAVGAESATPR